MALLGLVYDAHALTFYVDSSIPQSGNGLSWATAFKTIQEGIDAASEADTVVVAEGTYVENVKLRSNNIVLTSVNPFNRGVVAGTIIDGSQAGPVITFSGGEDETCVVTGFTICNGSDYQGGGVRGNDNHATIKNNTICGNGADWGGGLYRCHGTIQNNTITGNSARFSSGGGLFWCRDGTIQNNIISGNSAAGDGGGLSDCVGTIQNNTITGNSAGRYGGGLSTCEGTIQNNAITGNSAESHGGGLDSCGGTIQNNMIAENSAGEGGGLASCSTIENNVISANSAVSGGGLYSCAGPVQNNIITGNSAKSGGGLHSCGGTIRNNTIAENWAEYSGGGLSHCQAVIRNCTIWGNTAPDESQLLDCYLPTYSCIQDWTRGGEGNIAEDPRFVDPDGPDNNPQTYEDNNYRLRPDSPCIDAGKNEEWMWNDVDLDGNPRISHGRSSMTVDMGAYEYRFSVRGIAAVPGGGIELTWLSTPGQNYTIWWQLDLLAGEWVMGETIPSQGDVTSWTDPAAPNWAKFYRIEMK